MIWKSTLISLALPAAVFAGVVVSTGRIPVAPKSGESADTSQAPRRESLAPSVFAVDAVHSSIIFRCKHLNVSYAYGRFNEISGSFALPDDGEGAMIDVTVRTESVDTGNKGRDGHLMGPDFFDAKQYPTMAFKSTKVTRVGHNRFQADGTLLFRGVAKEMTIDIDKVGEGPGMRGATIAGFETTFTISRKEFGVNYMPEGLGDDVRITVSLEGAAK